MAKIKLKNTISGQILEIEASKLDSVKNNPSLIVNGKFVFEILEEAKEEKHKKEKK